MTQTSPKKDRPPSVHRTHLPVSPSRKICHPFNRGAPPQNERSITKAGSRSLPTLPLLPLLLGEPRRGGKRVTKAGASIGAPPTKSNQPTNQPTNLWLAATRSVSVAWRSILPTAPLLVFFQASLVPRKRGTLKSTGSDVPAGRLLV